MKEPRLTRQAKSDMEDAWEYVSPAGEVAADRFLERLLEQIRLHAQFPMTGRSREALFPGLRSFVVKPFVVFFRPAEDTIEVIRILHGRRDVDSITWDDN